jgi:hypothetical protein
MRSMRHGQVMAAHGHVIGYIAASAVHVSARRRCVVICFIALLMGHYCVSSRFKERIQMQRLRVQEVTSFFAHACCR